MQKRILLTGKKLALNETQKKNNMVLGISREHLDQLTIKASQNMMDF